MKRFCFVQAIFGCFFGAFIGLTSFWFGFDSSIYLSIIVGAVIGFACAGYCGDSFWEAVGKYGWWT